MPTPFVMPKLGLTMEEGTIAEWLVSDGAEVREGDDILRIETDKTETDVEAPHTGTLHHTGAVGDTFACGETIGWYLEDGEAMPEQVAAAAPAQASPAAASAGPIASVPVARPDGQRLFASPNARRIAGERGIDLMAVRGTGPNGRIVSEDLASIVASPAAARAGAGTSVPSAAALALANSLGLDATIIMPDPRTGRVSKEAVAAYARALLAAQTSAPAPDTAPPEPQLPAATQVPSEVIPLKGMRGTIARRMHESLDQMAQLTLFVDADMDAVVADREQRKSTGVAPSYTDYVIAAAARALTAHPIANSQITSDGVALLPTVHVGMAVALDGGLIVPVVTDTCARNLSDLSEETSRLAAAARNGELTLSELEGGTFSVSTLGMFGVDGFTPVINPPNTAILGVGRLRDEVTLVEGQVQSVKRLTLSLTWDHRAFDGAPAAAFAQNIAERLADPQSLDDTA